MHDTSCSCIQYFTPISCVCGMLSFFFFLFLFLKNLWIFNTDLQQYLNVFILGDLHVYYKDWLPDLMNLINLAKKLIFPDLTKLLSYSDVYSAGLFRPLPGLFVLHWEIMVMLLHQFQNLLLLKRTIGLIFITQTSIILLLIVMLVIIILEIFHGRIFFICAFFWHWFQTYYV